MTRTFRRTLLAILALGLVSYPILAATTDMNADTRDDLIWRDNQSGDVAVWLMNGAGVLQGPVVASGISLAWKISGVGDFDNDGRADLLWRHAESGGLAMWLMAGVTVKQSVAVATVPLSSQVVGVGDLNGDNYDDVVWRDAQNGAVSVWLMSGATVFATGVISAGVPLEWEISGIGNFDDGGTADLLWRDTVNGGLAVWLMNGQVVTQSRTIATAVPLEWEIADTADLDGDGRHDIVWRNSQTGDVAIWLMNGGTVLEGPVIASGVPLAWHIATVRDVNGDGSSDLVWRHAETGDVTVWLMSGTDILQALVVATGVPLAWDIQDLVHDTRAVPVGQPPMLASVAVTGKTTLAVNETAQFTATANFTGGPAQTVTGASTWSSSNETVATVSSGGLVTARGAGSADIRATHQHLTGSLAIQVSAPTQTVQANFTVTPDPETNLLAGQCLVRTNVPNGAFNVVRCTFDASSSTPIGGLTSFRWENISAPEYVVTSGNPVLVNPGFPCGYFGSGSVTRPVRLTVSGPAGSHTREMNVTFIRASAC